MSTTNQPLTYRFSAIYKDGDIYDQPEDDRSILHEGDGEWWPSAFKDVDQNKLELFQLINENDGVWVTVNMVNGKFNVNGVDFTMNEQDQIVTNLKLIYFREVRRDNIDGVWQEPRITKYYVGYEGKDQNGKKVKRLMGLDA